MTLGEYRGSPYAWPGGYTILAVTDYGEYMCHACATTSPEVHEDGNADGWRIDAFEIYWEGPVTQCCACNADINSEYGDPEEDDT